MLEAYGQTDVGRRRKLNEDSYVVDVETHLYGVCDGMGGHNAGEVASRMAIETLESFIQKSHREKEITWLQHRMCMDTFKEGFNEEVLIHSRMTVI